jgi:uncharacterized protein (TIGR00730 family)
MDADLNNKPAVIVNNDGSWDHFLQLMDRLHKLGTVKEQYSRYLSVVDNADDAVRILEEKHRKLSVHTPHVATPEPDIINQDTIIHNKKFRMPDRNICVFCSASITKKEYLDEGYEVGKFLARQGYGCISGAGKTGIMGQVVKGAYENDGWSGGSNVPHIIRMEGLPDGLSEFWPRADIYTRMQVMIEHSNAFLVMPGGMGTVQELLAMLILKELQDDLMKDKKIIVFNKYDKDVNMSFWQPVIEILKQQNSLIKELEVVDSIQEVFEKLKL